MSVIRPEGSPPLHSSSVRPTARPSKWEWVQAILLATTLAWTTLGLGGYVPQTMVVTSALVGALLSVNLLERAFTRAAMARLHPAGWLPLPFLAYAAANVVYVSPVKWLGWLDWFWWAEACAVFWVVLNGLRSRATRRMVFLTLVALALVGVFMACYQRFVDPEWLMMGRQQWRYFIGRASGPFGSPNSFAAFLVLVLPAVAALAIRRRARATERVWWGWLTVVLAFGLVLPISRGAWIALGLGATLGPLFAGRGTVRRRVLFASSSLAAVLVTAAVVIAVAPKVRFRFAQLVEQSGETTRPHLWRAGWRLFSESPLLGTGAASFNVSFERHRPEGFRDEPEWAHNEYLNTLSDYGAVGAVLLLGAVLTIALRCALSRREPGRSDRDWIDDPTTHFGLGVGMLAFGLQLFIDFHLKIPALALTLAVIAALVVSRAWPVALMAGDGWAGRRATSLFAAIGCATAVGIVFTPAFHAHALAYRARRLIDGLAITPPNAADAAERMHRARGDLSRAVAVDSRHGQAWADLSYASAYLAGVEPQRQGQWAREAEVAAERALALSRAPYEFWVRRGVARDLQGRWLEAGNDFTAALAAAPHNANAWFYHADHLSRRPTEYKLAEAALAFCLRLDPGNPAGLALRQRLAISTKVP